MLPLAFGHPAPHAQALQAARGQCGWDNPIRIVNIQTGETETISCGDKARTASPAQIDQMVSNVRRSCEMNNFMHTYVDCACLEQQANAQARKTHPQTAHKLIQTVTMPVAAQCVKRDSAYKVNHYYCNTAMSGQQRNPAAVEEFCDCLGNYVADGFMQDRRVTVRIIDQLRSAAFKQCKRP